MASLIERAVERAKLVLTGERTQVNFVAGENGFPIIGAKTDGAEVTIAPFGDLSELPEIEVFGAAWNEEGEASGSMSIHVNS